MRLPFRRQFRQLQIKRYMATKAKVRAVSDEGGQSFFDLVSIAFNNEIVIGYQIKLLKKYLIDEFSYTVVDNSSNPAKQKVIAQLCIDSGVNYVLPPSNPFLGEVGSGSHGATLNWAYKNFICSRKPKYFGFLDHDVFPVERTSILENLSDFPIFGKIDVRGDRWYLWSGFSFFCYDFLKGEKVDFMPEPGVDTGGKNWHSVYSKIDKSLLSPLAISYDNLRPGDNKQTDLYERMGSWIHTVNASEWVGAPHKNTLVANLLDRYL